MSAATWPIPCGIRVYLYHLNLPPSSSPPQGYGCSATDAELARYLDYTPRALCPQDWFFVQRLIFTRDCFSLPRRRCMAVTPARVEEVSPVAGEEADEGERVESNRQCLSALKSVRTGFAPDSAISRANPFFALLCPSSMRCNPYLASLPLCSSMPAYLPAFLPACVSFY